MNIDDLARELTSRGFKVDYRYDRAPGEPIEIKAWRPVTLPARRCDLNVNKPVAIFIDATQIRDPRVWTTPPFDTCEVSIRGSTPDGTWWDLKAYSLAPHEVIDRLDSLEQSLVAAWNALA